MLHRENQLHPSNSSSAADLIKEFMDYHSITQQDLAQRIGVSQKHISELLNRKTYLNPDEALKIQKVMGISSSLLLNLNSNYLLNEQKDKVMVSDNNVYEWTKINE
ncbi:helix-turn-helix domain-containing protein [Fructilactobacillus hinvesii]|uniref:Helix-turn-helix domain-containing protein n=1 Tax=Fructilactobacillus hinvesii TaxID=2940300 RepID=A0ABY5BUD9_9LACO|nr:helix-turn-helix domain-containing protein [Fructilactobacillus hinvesii]USS88052.1 helix-turn-helix domain-containing protein [Fructilactobacillus hinvesii]